MMQVSLALKTPTNVVMKTANFGLKLVALTRIPHVVSSAISCQPVPNVGSKTLPLVKRKRFVLVTKLNVQPVFPCPMAHLALKKYLLVVEVIYDYTFTVELSFYC